MPVFQEHVYLYSVDYPSAEAHVALKIKSVTLCGIDFKDLKPYKSHSVWKPDNGICKTCAREFRKRLAGKYNIIGW